MGMATSKVRLNICGSSYVVNTSESEDYMKNLADRLNLDMNELMASSNSVSITTAAVMTALNYRDELEKASGSADNMRRQIKDYLEDAASAKMAAEEARRENASLKRRVDELERRLRPYLEKSCREHGLSMMFFMLTNIFKESTELLYYGKNSEELLEKAFKLDEVSGGSINLPGVVSRKKQILPMIVSASNNM